MDSFHHRDASSAFVADTFRALQDATEPDIWFSIIRPNGQPSLLRALYPALLRRHRRSLHYIDCAETSATALIEDSAAVQALKSAPGRCAILLIDNVDALLEADEATLCVLASILALLRTRIRVRCCFYASSEIQRGSLPKDVLDDHIFGSHVDTILADAHTFKVTTDTDPPHELRRTFESVLRARGIVDSKLANDLCQAALINQKRNEAKEALTALSPPVPLPPSPPTVLWSEHKSAFNQRLTIPEFLNLVWREYTERKLLYTDHIRQIDVSLYKAMQYQAMRNQQSLDEYLKPLGVLTRKMILKPTPDIEEQARILRAVRYNHAVDTYAKKTHADIVNDKEK